MMRQIKFRGKRKDTGEWVHGDLLHIDGGCLIYFGSQTETETPYIEKSSPIAVELFKTEIAVVDPESVGLFTGLLDANGKEIYEGDILRCIGQRVDNAGKIYYREVTFKRGSFCIYCADMDIHSPIISHIMNGVLGWDVVGNIHDTPELLNEKCHA